MAKTAFIFPGQGGQFVGQGKTWVEKSKEIKEIFTMADDISGLPISRLCFEGPLNELSLTSNLQPAVLAVSLAALHFMEKEASPSFVAGHSLGEFAALCAAKVITYETAFQLVSKRAVLMQKATEKKPGAMVAVIGMTEEDLKPICELAGAEGIAVLANFNSPEQIVASGEQRPMAALIKYVKLKKGRAIPLPVSGGFHSILMKEASDNFAPYIKEAKFENPICPVLPNALAKPLNNAEEIKNALLQQIINPVYWTQTVDYLVKENVTTFYEAWPKAYLTNIVKKCLPQDTIINLKTVDGV